ncbi:polycystic kidney disease protein 1-like 2 [Chiloscyllium plagiosum]|uniref:polycystic kidney disease protein 1-like 2 n=1 Tax=Chiloscyllium plagiosum TaxID=36176 RepID=UPI001CB842B9|nr:polycystic kidney disease protein 1-like 2 [Chiloscyllium plagiosum]
MTNCSSMFSFICEFDSKMPPIYSVFHIIPPLEWQFNPNPEKFSCTVYTGDGKMSYFYHQQQSFTMAHLYNALGIYSISIECKNSKDVWAIGKSKIVLEPVNKPNGLQCYSPSLLDTIHNCAVQYGDTLWIQTEKENGFNLAYTISIGNTTLHTSTLIPGVIVIDGSSQSLIGPGQHNVTVYARNSSIEISQNLTILLLLKISGLKAELEPHALKLGNNITIKVSVSQGSPISLQFDFIDSYNILSYTAKSFNGQLPVYTFPMQKEGTFLVMVTATNILSTEQLIVGHVMVTNDFSKRSTAIRKRALPNNIKICTTRCSRQGSDATKRLLKTLPNSEDLFSNTPNLEQVIEDNLQKFSGIAINASSLQGVETANTYLDVITSHPDKLTVRSQEEANNALLNLSDKLQNLPTVRPSDELWKLYGAKTGLNAVNNLLSASMTTNSFDVEEEKMANMFDVLLTSMDKIFSSLESQIQEDDPPTVFQASSFSMALKRYGSKNLKGSRIDTLETNSFSCIFPDSIDLQSISDKPIQLRMVNFRDSPLTRKMQRNVSGPLSNISLSSNGSELKVMNLLDPIEILLPRSNSTQLFPATYTTAMNLVFHRFHVTDPESAIVISVESNPVTSTQLYFKHASKPNETLYEFEKSFFPQSSTSVEAYSCVITPEMLMGRNGTYYLAVKPLQQSAVPEANITFTISTISTKCLYWDEMQHRWSTHGCKVGPKSNLNKTQCLCNHFSLFATSLLVMPNTVDVMETVKLFSQIKDNSVVVSLLAAVFGVYIILVIWTRMKDRQDLMKVKKTVLADNDPFAKYHYLVKVFTGHRRGAGTTSKVVMMLYGSAGQSDSHHLTDPKKPVFQQGSVDEFLLATPFPLGNLTSIRLWHNNSGSSPSWYINHVIVQDPETGKQWYFFCNCWLAVDAGQFVLDKTFHLASEAEMKDFSNLFFIKTSESFTDQHIWFSIFARPPRSSFTRVQRVSCCFSLLLCTMLTNIMFWGTADNGTEQEEQLDDHIIGLREVIIGIESALIIFPVNLIIVQIFRNTRPKSTDISATLNKSASDDPSECQRTPENIMMDIKRIASSLPGKLKDAMPTLEDDIRNANDINKLLVLIANIIQHCNEQSDTQEVAISDNENDSSATCSPDQQNEDNNSMVSNPEDNNSTCSDPEKETDQMIKHFLYYVSHLLNYVETELQEMELKTFQNPYTQIHATDQVQKIIQFIKAAINSADANHITKRSKKTSPVSKGLPWWFIYIGWLLVFVTSSVSAFFTMLYSFDYGKEKSIQWLKSMIVSFVESVFIIQPLKVLFVAAFIALIVKKVERNENEENYNENLLSTINEDLNVVTPNYTKRSDAGIYKPPSVKHVEKMKAQHLKEKKMYDFIKDIFAHVGFLVVLAIIAYGERSPHSFYLNKALNDSFTRKFNGSLAVNDFYIWANEILLPNLYGPYEGFITDGNSKLLGSPRIRQVRIKPTLCPVPTRLVDSIQECRAPYSYGDEDMLDFGNKGNFSVNTESLWLASAWHYQSESQLKEYPVWGKIALYRGGGFVAELGTENKTADRVINYLKENTWVDMYTRAIFVEFTVYNANVNLFCVVTLMLEMNAIGVFLGNMQMEIIRLYHYVDQNYSSIIGAQVVFIIIVIYYMVKQGKLLKQKRMKYFCDKWNLINLAIILCSCSALGLYIKRAVLGNRVMNDYLKNQDRFVNFYGTAITDSSLGYVIAFLVSLATVKLWNLLRLNPKMHLITSSLQRAWSNLLGLLVILMVLLIAYSSVCYLVLGLYLSSYRTFSTAVITIIHLLLGAFNYNEVLQTYPFLGAIIISTCVIIMTFILINIFISALLMSFSEERHHPMPLEDEEIIDLLLMKLCNIIGIQRKGKEEPLSNAEEMAFVQEK